jgi:hypothetical protein
MTQLRFQIAEFIKLKGHFKLECPNGSDYICVNFISDID